jgi:hypothetical protein
MTSLEELDKRVKHLEGQVKIQEQQIRQNSSSTKQEINNLENLLVKRGAIEKEDIMMVGGRRNKKIRRKTKRKRKTK